MPLIQRLMYRWFPEAEYESRCWVFSCPKCSQETSIHDLGGVRYRACGNPRKWVSCRHCSWSGMAPLMKRDAPLVENRPVEHLKAESLRTGGDVTDVQEAYHSPAATSARLWIDGVGCWQIFWGDEFVIGGPSSAEAGRLSLLANLARRHAAIRRGDDSWILSPAAETQLNSQQVTQPVILKGGDVIGLGTDVSLRFLIPSALSQSARLEFLSSHRPAQRIEGIVLVQPSCQLGAGEGVHIQCPSWETQVVLFERDNRLWCRGDRTLLLNDQPIDKSQALSHGDVLTGENWRLRMELDAPPEG